MKIGRNESCPCGSGKKYKHCCLVNSMLKRTDLVLQKSQDDSDSVFSPKVIMHYGSVDLASPIIDTDFLHDVSAPRLLYSLLLVPQVEEVASSITNKFLTRGKSEAKRIESFQTPEQLIQHAKGRPDPLNHAKLVSRLLEHGRSAADLILKEMYTAVNATFIELGVRILYRFLPAINTQIADLIDHGPRRAYQISLLCMLLGFSGHLADAQISWDYYYLFSELFPEETYSDGPLLALFEYRRRFRPDMGGNVNEYVEKVTPKTLRENAEP